MNVSAISKNRRPKTNKQLGKLLPDTQSPTNTTPSQHKSNQKLIQIEKTFKNGTSNKTTLSQTTNLVAPNQSNNHSSSTQNTSLPINPKPTPTTSTTTLTIDLTSPIDSVAAPIPTDNMPPPWTLQCLTTVQISTQIYLADPLNT